LQFSGKECILDWYNKRSVFLANKQIL